MKKTLFVLSLLFVCQFCFSQSIKEIEAAVRGTCIIDNNSHVSYVKVIELKGYSKDELYNTLQTYFSYYYKNANNVLQFEDKEAGLLVGKGIYPNLNRGNLAANQGVATGAWHDIRVEIKDEKIRVTISLSTFEFPPGPIFGLYYSIAEACPISETYKKRNWYTKLYYNAHLRVLAQFSEIEKYVIDKKSNLKSTDDNW